MTAKVFTLKIAVSTGDERFAYHRPSAHLVGIRMMIGKDCIPKPLGVCSDIVALGDDTCKFLDLCVKEVSGIIVNQSDTALVALTILRPVIGIDLKFACALDIKLLITDSEVHRSTAVQVVLRCISLTYEGSYSHIVYDLI